MLRGPEGKLIFGMVKVGERGQIVIPAEARKAFHIKPGDSMMLVGDEQSGLALLTSESLTAFFAAKLEGEGGEEQ